MRCVTAPADAMGASVLALPVEAHGMTPRDRLYQTLTPRQRQDYEQFERTILQEHVRPREGQDGNSYVLDRRNALLLHGKRMTLRDPSDPRWPGGGRSTLRADEAKAWAREHYIPKLWEERQLASIHPSAGHTTVRQAAADYFRRRVRVKEAAAGPPAFKLPVKYASLLSKVRKHVLPAFGDLLFSALDRTMVREMAESLEIEEVHQSGISTRRPASYGQKKGVVAALLSLWKDVFPDVTAPFSGAMVRHSAVDADEDDADEEDFDAYDIDATDVDALQHALSAEEGKGAMDPATIRRGMVGVWYDDLEKIARPNLKQAMVPNTVFLFVLLVATGARISEILRIRWRDINWKVGFILIRQSKLKRGDKKPKRRITPLQNSLVPWLRLLQTMTGATDDSKSFLIQSSPRGNGRQRASKGTVSARMSRALTVAGVKPPGKSTHWGRSTNSTWGMHSPHVKEAEQQHFLGHRPFSGTTNQYIAMLIRMLRPEHREIIQLPSPEEIRAELPSFVPAEVPRKRKPQSRTNEAKAERRRRREAAPMPPSTIEEFVEDLLRPR